MGKICPVILNLGTNFDIKMSKVNVITSTYRCPSVSLNTQERHDVDSSDMAMVQTFMCSYSGRPTKLKFK